MKLLASLLALFASLPATAQDIACPQLAPGTRFDFVRTSYNKPTPFFSEFKEVRDGVLQWTSTQGDYTSDPMGNTVRSSTGATYATAAGPARFYVRTECPFRLGESREYKGVSYRIPSGATVTADFRVRVDPEWVTMDTKVGPMKVVKFTMEAPYRNSRGGGGTLTQTSYFSPELGALVRAEFMDSYDPAGKSVTELVGVKKP